jgi:hypothetical protein
MLWVSWKLDAPTAWAAAAGVSPTTWAPWLCVCPWSLPLVSCTDGSVVDLRWSCLLVGRHLSMHWDRRWLESVLGEFCWSNSLVPALPFGLSNVYLCHGILGLGFAYLGSGLGIDASTALHYVNYVVCLSLHWQDHKFRCLEGLCFESLHLYYEGKLLVIGKTYVVSGTMNSMSSYLPLSMICY